VASHWFLEFVLYLGDKVGGELDDVPVDADLFMSAFALAPDICQRKGGDTGTHHGC
jgi:hypothetical protein